MCDACEGLTLYLVDNKYSISINYYYCHQNDGTVITILKSEILCKACNETINKNLVLIK